MPRPPKGVTIADVAARAGVSLATVSRTLNGNPTVDPALAERVHEAAVALQYTASPLARSLVLGRTQTIAVVVPDLGNPTFQEILRGLNTAAGRDGYHVLIADSAEDVSAERALSTQARRRTDGLILCAPRMAQDDLDALLAQLAPVVLVNRYSDAAVPVVRADYGPALRAMLDHVYGLGHRQVLYLAGVGGSASNALRLAAIAEFRAAHADVTIDELPCGVDFDSGAQAADAVLASEATAVLAFNDLVAMGLMSTVERRGIRVPDDLSITGFDDIPFARYTSPPLTTAAVPAAEIGARAWEAMDRLLADGTVGPALSLLPRLEVRESTGPVRG